jgi:hypothetical protein
MLSNKIMHVCISNLACVWIDFVAMDADDALNALLAGDGDDLDSILKEAGLTNGSDEIDLDALLADIDAEDTGIRTAAALALAPAAAPAPPAASNAPDPARVSQARGVLSHALAAAAAPEGASVDTSVAAAVVKRERNPSDMDEDDVLQVLSKCFTAQNLWWRPSVD